MIGLLNLAGVLTSLCAVAFCVVSPSMAAIVWNFGAGWLGLPASRLRTPVSSMLGGGVRNAVPRGRDGAAGADWDEVRFRIRRVKVVRRR